MAIAQVAPTMRTPFEHFANALVIARESPPAFRRGALRVALVEHECGTPRES